jgi:hypothetical protein
MQKTVVALFGLSLLATACGNAGIPNATFADDGDGSVAVARAKPAKSVAVYDELPFMYDYPDAKSEAAPVAPLAQRKVGDLSVHRFSGSFTKTPLTLSEEVTARAGSLIVIEYTLEQGAQRTKLRVTHDVNTDRVLRVREIQGKKELPSSIEAYDAMIAKTMFVPDENDGQVAKTSATCMIGEQAVDCEKIDYRVSVDGEQATFTVTRGSDGRDISGEIASSDGKILYRADTVEQRQGTPSGVATR